MTSKLAIFFCVLTQANSFLVPLLNFNKHEQNITKELVRPNNEGYRITKYEVITEDGYVLQVFKLINEDCVRRGNLKKPPVLMMHGLLESSDIFLDLGPGRSLAYILAAHCFEVWLGNIRGNFHGRNHLILNPDSDEEFWRFSVDEMGVYDIPAIVDYVIKESKSSKVNYIGFSQGCGVFYIMCSEKFGYCEKINLKISLAPSTRHLNTKSAMFRNVCEYIERNREELVRNGVFELFSKGAVTQNLLEGLCKEKRYEEFCLSLVKAFDADHPGSIKKKTIKLLFEHFPAGTSVQNIARYGQSMRSKNFVKFNYGDKNFDVYGRNNPPKYNLSAVKVPVVVLYGRNDGIVDERDVKWLIEKLPNVVGKHEIDDQLWTHLDNVYSRFVPKLLAPKIIEALEIYSNYF